MLIDSPEHPHGTLALLALALLPIGQRQVVVGLVVQQVESDRLVQCTCRRLELSQTRKGLPDPTVGTRVQRVCRDGIFEGGNRLLVLAQSLVCPAEIDMQPGMIRPLRRGLSQQFHGVLASAQLDAVDIPEGVVDQQVVLVQIDGGLHLLGRFFVG